MKLQSERERPTHNGWIVLIFVLAFLGTEDWIFVGCLFAIIIYVGWIQYLQMRYDVKIK